MTRAHRAMAGAPTETTLVLAIRERLALERGVLLWRNNTGKLQDIKRRWVTFGLGVGGADLIGCVGGRFFALEVKLPGRSPTPEQECWATAVLNTGGFCGLARSVDDAVACLDRCRRGESS